MDTMQWVMTGLVLFVACALQGAAGFGSGLLAIPLLLWIGYEPQEAIAMSVMASFVQSMAGAHQLRKHIPWRKITLIITVILITTPLGVLTLQLVADFDKARVQQIFGFVLAGVLILYTVFKIKPRQTLHWIWSVIAGFLSGYIGGLAGMGGPPIVLWIVAHDWTSHQTRGALFANFCARLPVQLVLMYLIFGTSVLHGMLIGLLAAPIVLAGNALGMYAGHRMERAVLLRVAMGLLWFITISSIVSPYLSSR